MPFDDVATITCGFAVEIYTWQTVPLINILYGSLGDRNTQSQPHMYNIAVYSKKVVQFLL